MRGPVSKPAALALCVAALLVLTAQGAAARVFTNPVSPLEQGEAAAGLGIEQFDRDVLYYPETADEATEEGTSIDRTRFIFGYGLQDNIAGEFSYATGRVEVDGDDLDPVDTTEFGFGLRIRTGEVGQNAEGGLALNVITGSLSNSDTDGDFVEADVSFGASNELDDGLNGYAALVFSSLSGVFTVDTDGSEVDVEFWTEDNLGGYAGVEFAPEGGAARFGGELHLLHETGFAFFALINF